MRKFDFSGWATKNDLKCADGRTIRHGAFREDDGKVVPLVWQHMHNSPENVLGHALLENRDEGVYAYCEFNDTDMAKHAKELVRHGDISSLSIYANKLKQNGGDVLHGSIREVSLVLAGANPGAMIDFDSIQHGADSVDPEYATEAVIYNNDMIDDECGDISHSEEDEEIEDEENDLPVIEVDPIIIERLAHSADEEENNMEDATIQDVYDSLNEDQKTVVEFLIGQAASAGEGDDDMKHNVFDGDDEMNSLSHGEMMAIIDDAKRFGSLKESALQHGVEDIDILFPDATNLNDTPQFIKRKTEWVDAVMSATHHTPFSRIKSVFADITEDDARAKGYLSDRGEKGTGRRDAYGNLVDASGNRVYKKEEVFSLLKRTTTPATIYKKQRLDRDDVLDITDFDVVSWIKQEMRLMLDEEIARAILIGDGRATSSDEKINESNIRPIWKDDDLFTIKSGIQLVAADDENSVAKKFIRTAIKSRKNFRGTGTPVLFTTEDMLTDMLLLEDNMGRVIYDTMEKLTTALRVSKIVTVPVMENQTRVDGDSKTRTLLGLIVNLADYNVGADKGGSVNLFDDFDIDYNAQKYLIETRCSGALTVPYSAIAIESIPVATSGT